MSAAGLARGLGAAASVALAVACGGESGPQLESPPPATARDSGAPPPLTLAAAFDERATTFSPARREVALAFYEQRQFRPAWSSWQGPSAEAFVLLRRLESAELDGLESAAYRADALRTRIDQTWSATPVAGDDRIGLDLALTEAFLRYADHLGRGRVEPTALAVPWVDRARQVDLRAALAAATSGAGVEAALRDVEPRHAAYGKLRRELGWYRSVAAAGGWPRLPSELRFKPAAAEDEAARRMLATRLRLEGFGARDLRGAEGEGSEVAALSRVVARFQRLRGLEADGVVGPKTLAALNVPAAERVRQIEWAMERWRWVADDLGERHVFVNIPAFELEVIDSGRASFRTRVVVGKPSWATPVVTDQIEHVVLNPYWNVPASIARAEVLPALRRDPNYLDRQNMELVALGDESLPFGPSAINWDEVRVGRFPFRFRQRPGPGNALGRVKLLFPNRHAVYLHDTQARSLFARPERAFSHGCVRVHEPLELAGHLLRHEDPKWTAEGIEAVLATEASTGVRLRRPVPVHLFYFTAFVNADGEMEFRRDIYGADRALQDALMRREDLLLAATPAGGEVG